MKMAEHMGANKKEECFYYRAKKQKQRRNKET
jgi:hypothetical protein